MFPFTRPERVSRFVAYLVILDGEENESLRVLLKNRFILLLLPQSGCHGDFFCFRLIVHRDTLDGHCHFVVGNVFLLFWDKDGLLDGRLHLEVLDILSDL